MNSSPLSKNENLSSIKQVLEENPRGMTIQDISKEIDLNRNSVAKYLEILTISGEAERKMIGPAKVYSLSEKVPLSAVLDYSDNCILVLNSSMELVQANDGFFERFGLDREKVLKKRIDEIDIPIFSKNEDDDEPLPVFPEESIVPDIQSALNSDNERNVEVVFDEESEKCYIEVSMIPTTFQNGRTGLTLICKDITERKRAVEESRMYRKRLEELVKDRTREIRKTKERLNSLINASDDSIYMVDGECRYTLVNDELTRRLGVDENELVGKKFVEFHGNEETEEFRNKVREVFEKGEDVRHMHSWDDPERRFLRTLSPIMDPDTGEVTNVVVVSKDITILEESQ